MAQSLGVQEIQQRRDRSRVGLGPVVTLVAVTVAALFLAPAIWAGNTPAERPAPNPVPRVAPANPGWQTAAENAGFTGRLGAAAPEVAPYSYGSWANSAEAAGYTGRLGGAAAATTGTTTYGQALSAAKVSGRLGGGNRVTTVAPATTAAPATAEFHTGR
jgi:hypothetical protein